MQVTRIYNYQTNNNRTNTPKENFTGTINQNVYRFINDLVETYTYTKNSNKLKEIADDIIKQLETTVKPLDKNTEFAIDETKITQINSDRFSLQNIGQIAYGTTFYNTKTNKSISLQDIKDSPQELQKYIPDNKNGLNVFKQHILALSKSIEKGLNIDKLLDIK